MEKYLFLSWSYTGAVNMLEQGGGCAPKLLGQLYVPRPDASTVFVEVALGSPDIGNEPDDYLPSKDEATTMIPHIRLSCPRPGVVDMDVYISGSPSRLLGQLYVNLSPIDPRIWYFPSYKGSPDIGDGPDQQPPVALPKNPPIFLSCSLQGVVDMSAYIGGRPARLLGELFVPDSAPGWDYWQVQIAPDSPDIGDEPSEQQPQEADKAAARKGMPIARGVLDYFPAALLKLAEVSRVGNEQHNPGQALHWAYDKSSDHADALLRHLIDRRTLDSDGIPHVAKVAWRALALLQAYLEDNDPELHARMEKQRAAMKEGR